MAGDHFAITLLGDFQLNLADLLQLLNQIELMAAAKKRGSQKQWTLRNDQVPVQQSTLKISQMTLSSLCHMHTYTH